MKRLPYVLTVVLTILIILLLHSISKAQTSFNISNKTTGDTLLTIDNSGQMGLGITVPGAGFHMQHDQGALFSGTFGSGVIPVEGAGTRLMWYPAKAAFRVGRTFGSFWDDNNIGTYSMAFGNNTTANASYSTAMGWNTTASGFASTAMGRNTTASGYNATALGISTAATGSYSTALGNASSATGENSTSMGRMTVASGNNSMALGNNIWAAGEGSVAIGLSDQSGLQIIQDSTLAIMGGRMGIGTVSPTTSLEVADTIFSSLGGFKFPDGSVQETAAGVGSGNTLDHAYDQGGDGAGRTITADNGAVTIAGTDGFLLTGTFSSGSIPVEGTGTRLMWYPAKSAFRVGSVNSNQWDDLNIGDYSMAIGRRTTASGAYAQTYGNFSIASGDHSMALGRGATASGNTSVAIGRSIEASGNFSFAIGVGEQAGTNVSQDTTLAIVGGRIGFHTVSPTHAFQVADTIYSSSGGFKFPDGSVQLTASSNGVFSINDLSDAKAILGDIFLGIGAGENDDESIGSRTTAVGANALYLNTTGWGNTAIGFRTLRSNTFGGRNTGIGHEALFSNTSGDRNTATGDNALYSNTSGYENSATGDNALYSNTTGGYNTANGSSALQINTTGWGNTAVGYKALNTNSTSSFNTAIGLGALQYNSTGGFNVSLGTDANHNNREGSFNTMIGYHAGRGSSFHNKSGNVFLGHKSGYFETGDNKLYIENSDTTFPLIWGDFNTDSVKINGDLHITGNISIDGTGGGLASSVDDLYDGVSGGNSIFLGSGSGINDDWSNNLNAAVGINALFTNITGTANLANGYQTLYSNISGGYNTAVGSNALYSNTTAGFNTATGANALYSNTTGTTNTATGYQGLYSNLTGNYNTATGQQALYSNFIGSFNTATGVQALHANTDGSFNVGLGYRSNFLNQEGSQNTIIGYQAGYGLSLHNKSGNIFLGYQAGYNEAGDNKLYIENSNSPTPLIWGDFDADSMRVHGDLHITGNIHIDGTQSTMGNSGFVSEGSFGIGNIPVEGMGTRMMWYPGKGAFRAGWVLANGSTFWNDDSIGDQSVAFGVNTIASGDQPTALGESTSASGQGSTAMGTSTTASGTNSTAMGYGATASGLVSTAIGETPTASGEYSISMGTFTTASGENSTAIGHYTAARARRAISIGSHGKANHPGSMVFSATNSGMASDSVTSGRESQIVLRGHHLYITNSGGIAPTSISRLINTSTGGYLSTGGSWTNASSREYKENITELSLFEAIDAVKKLNPVTYNYKAEQDENYVGFIAEDVPELTATKDRKGLSAMDIVAVLTKVVQNQQVELELLKEEINQLKQNQ